MEHSFFYNNKNNAKYSPIFKSLIQKLERVIDMMTQHHRLLIVYVEYLEIFDYCIQLNHAWIFVKVCQVDAELIYHLPSLSTCDNPHLLRSD